MDDHRAIDETAEIVAAYVENNEISPTALPGLIASVHKALVAITGEVLPDPQVVRAAAVAIRRSIQPGHLVCLEDGKKFKTLKRHLRREHNLGPEDYRAKWSLPPDYPMVAPSYALARSNLAKAAGLGLTRRQPAAVAKQEP